MKTLIKNKNTISKKDNLIILSNKNTNLSSFDLNQNEKKYIKDQQKNNQEIIVLNHYLRKIMIVNPKNINSKNLFVENIRGLGNKIYSELNEINNVSIQNLERDKIDSSAFVEGLSLSHYQFNNHKSKAKKNKDLTINIINNKNSVNNNEIEKLNESVKLTKDLVNTPFHI